MAFPNVNICIDKWEDGPTLGWSKKKVNMTLCQYEHQIITLCRSRSRISKKKLHENKEIWVERGACIQNFSMYIYHCFVSACVSFTPCVCMYLLMSFAPVHGFAPACNQYFPLLLLVPFTPTCALFISASLLSSHPLVTQSHYFFIVYFMSISWSTGILS